MQQWLRKPFQTLSFRKDPQTARMRLIYSLLGAAVLGLIAHGFAYLNYVPVHDMLNYVDHYAGEWEISLGRFAQPLYAMLRGRYTMPWLGGMLTILFIGLSAFLVSDLLEIKNRWLVLCSAGFLIANATMTEASACFLYISDALGLAMLLACIGAYALVRMRGVVSVVIACATFTSSMGLYQSYILVAVVLLLFCAMRAALTEHRLWKSQWRNWTRWLIALALTAAVYFGLYLLLQKHELSMSKMYNSPAQLASFTLAELMQLARHAYSSFVAFFLGLHQNEYTAFYACNLILMVCTILTLAWHVIRNRLPLLNVLVLVVGVLAFPGLALGMSILSRQQLIYFLTSHALFLMYPAMLALLSDMRGPKALSRSRMLPVALCVCLLFSSVRYSNELYTLQKVHYDKALSHVTRVMDRMEQVEGYVPGETPVVSVGYLSHAMTDLYRPEAYRWTKGVARSALTYLNSFGNFARMLGDPIVFDGDEGVSARYAAMEAVQQMPVYPAAGCCQMIDGVMVVRFPD